MIEINITSSPDKDMLGACIIYRNEIIIGKSKGDIIIQDEQLQATHIKLQIKENKMMLTSRSDVTHYFVNGKKYMGYVALKNNDEIQIGNTFFKITNFVDNSIDYSKIIKENIRAIVDDDPELDQVLQDIESDLKYISDNLE